MPSIDSDGPAIKRQKLVAPSAGGALLPPRRSRIFAPFRTVGLVSPTAIPFTAVPLGKTTFQITTSVGHSLQTYDLQRGLNLVFITRPQTPGLITATSAWADRLLAAWSSTDNSVGQGIWVFKRGKKVGQLEPPQDLREDIVQMIVLGSWIVGCCGTRVEVWKSATYEHYATLLPPYRQNSGEGNVLTGGIASMSTYTNKIFAGRENGNVEIWNVSTGKLVYTIVPATATYGAVTALQATPALSLLSIAYLNGQVVIHDVRADREVLRLQAGRGDQSPVTCISFRTDGLGAGDDGQEPGVMATGSFNSGDVTLWDLNKGGKRVGVLRGAHKAPSSRNQPADGGISKIEFLPGQAILITSGLDNSLKSWIFDQVPFSPVPRILHSRSGHAAPITTLSFLPSDADGADAGGKWILSSSQDRSLWGWSLRKDGQSTELSQGNIKKKAKSMGALSVKNSSGNPRGDAQQELRAPEITCLACSLNRDGGMGTMPGVKTMWASAKQLKGKSTATEQNLTGWESVVTGHRGSRVARTWFWGRKRAGRWTLETGDGGDVTSVAISPCGTFALVGSKFGGIDMYNLQSGMHRQRYPPKLTPSQAKRRQLELANQAPDNGHKTWAKGLGRHTKAVTGIQVDNLNRTVVSTGLDGRVKFWDFLSGRLLHEIDWSTFANVTMMRYHRASDLLALGCDDSVIRIVDIETHKVIRELRGCRGVINDLCFSNDGRWVLAADVTAVIRVWDLPSGHMIDAMRLTSPCTALAFSNTGEFLATAQADSIGIDIWTNRSLFAHIPTRHIHDDAEIPMTVMPTTSGEGGEGMLASAMAEDINGADAKESDGPLPTLDQLSKDVMTLSLVPKSRWQTLLNLDLIRERNKPQEPPKAPEKAAFFLQSLQPQQPPRPLNSNLQTSDVAPPATKSRLLRLDMTASESKFVVLLRQGSQHGTYLPFIEHLKTLGPAAADTEIRSLAPVAPYEELIWFVNALTEQLHTRRDYELVQAWMNVCLRCHGEVMTEEKTVLEAIRIWREDQRREAERLNSLVGYCAGVIGFLRSAR